MGKAVKWVIIILGGLIILLIAALLVIPLFLDVQKYKPEIEKRVADATGRPFSIGGDMDLSLFPWAGVSLSDVRLGNPQGFSEKDFLSIKSFDVRVKLLPLISRDFQVKRFILNGPRVVLIKDGKGRGNWEGLGKSSGKAPTKPPEEQPGPSEEKSAGGLPVKALAVGEFSITNGSVIWIDQRNDTRKEISDITLRLEDVSLERPVKLSLSAYLDGKPLSLKGSVGPVGKEPGKGNLPIDLSVKALNELDVGLKGSIKNAATEQSFDLDLEVSPFSPRKLSDTLGQSFPVTATDPEALQKVAMKAKIKGSPKDIAISGGTLDLDQSKLKFSARARELDKPDIALDLSLDKINLDRYLPPPGEKKPETGAKAEKAAPSNKGKIDYAPLRRLVLDAKISVGELVVKGARAEDIILKVTGKNGLFRLDPLSAGLYDGQLVSKGKVNVRQEVPKSDITLNAKGIQVGPLIQDFMKKDFIEGLVKADIAISM
jgi:AsmA protein